MKLWKKNATPPAVDALEEGSIVEEANVAEETSAFPGPSPNSATNLLIADVLLRGASKLFNGSAKGQMLRTLIDPAAAKRVLNGRTMGKSVVTYAATRLATRSIPGLLVVGGGLVAKTLLDRRSARQKAVEEAETPTDQHGHNPPD